VKISQFQNVYPPFVRELVERFSQKALYLPVTPDHTPETSEPNKALKMWVK
jgi:hypothetical protein